MNLIGLILFCGFAVLILVTAAAVVLALRAEGVKPAREAGHAPLPDEVGAEAAAERARQEAAVERGREVLNGLLQNVSRHVTNYMGDVGQYDTSLENHRASLEQVSTRDEAEDVGRRILEEIERMHQTNTLYRAQLEQANQVIAQQRDELARLSLDATTDFLTQIPNRRTLDARLREEFARFQRGGPPFSVALLDIDHFKRINDDHGHLMGDDVLVQITRLLAGERREMDFLARYGGEEFALLLPATQQAEALLLANRLRERVAQTALKSGPATIQSTLSAGVSEVLKSDTGIAEALRRADAALYRAKEKGRNQVASAH